VQLALELSYFVTLIRRSSVSKEKRAERSKVGKIFEEIPNFKIYQRKSILRATKAIFGKICVFLFTVKIMLN